MNTQCRQRTFLCGEHSLTTMGSLVYDESGKPYPSTETIIMEFNVPTPWGTDLVQLQSNIPAFAEMGGGGITLIGA